MSKSINSLEPSPKSAAPDTSPKQLPSEVWGRVISYLRRPMGVRGSVGRIDDYHQHDLTVAMRVNKTFHQYAGPILYSRVIVSNFPLFLYGVPSITPSDSQQTISSPEFQTRKLRLLTHIKRLDIAYTSLRTNCILGESESETGPLPAAILHHLNLPESVIPALTSDINLAMESLLVPLMGWAKSPFAPLLFPNLQIITTGAIGGYEWDMFNPNFTRLNFIPADQFQISLKARTEEEKLNPERKLSTIHHLFKQLLFGRYLTATSRPKFICNYVSSGPMTPIYNRHFPNDHLIQTRHSLLDSDEYLRTLPEVYTTHLLEQIHRGVWIHIAEGTLNRWIVDPIFRTCNAQTQSLVYTYIQSQLVMRRKISPNLNIDKGTKIEIYGISDPTMLYNAIGQLMGGHSNTVAYSHAEGMDTLKRYLGLDSGLDAAADAENDGHLCAEVEIMKGDAPPCPAL
ncbi:uncharacterized protein I303_103913 [Kwoniella dejecticola CBS 10117]|uniref:Uncharacterized protein n=1 Tax=Kwoniella dejecticola CBS 10117 TaxID=1296121 RepID=A0A1A6A827_9TREE|nr:uncharacterized protein I303_03931 [Kwoniella dejecticola CBS 10117]OBR86211.1 hypothetical protein I303_03931 [Kwoniella dejecticola CBS 10117]